jgi:hypothetical protein
MSSSGLTALLEIVKPTAELNSAMKFATICSRPATLLHPQMPRPKPAWLVLALLAAGTNSPLNAQENTASYHAGFELPDYTVGSIQRRDRKKPSADFDEVSGDRSILVG